VWNTSRVLSDDSVVGKTLGILVGYKASPAGIQIVFYLSTLALLIFGVLWQQRSPSVPPRSKPELARHSAHKASR
jgi:high-affinity iron transporter